MLSSSYECIIDTKNTSSSQQNFLLHLVGGAASSNRQQLMPKTDTKYRFSSAWGHDWPKMFYSCAAHLWITWESKIGRYKVMRYLGKNTKKWLLWILGVWVPIIKIIHYHHIKPVLVIFLWKLNSLRFNFCTMMKGIKDHPILSKWPNPNKTSPNHFPQFPPFQIHRKSIYPYGSSSRS